MFLNELFIKLLVGKILMVWYALAKLRPTLRIDSCDFLKTVVHQLLPVTRRPQMLRLLFRDDQIPTKAIPKVLFQPGIPSVDPFHQPRRREGILKRIRVKSEVEHVSQRGQYRRNPDSQW